MQHEEVTLRHPRWGEGIKVDKGLAELIGACWDAGIDTAESCQEAAPGMARIGFLSLGDMDLAYDLLSDDGEQVFYGWRWDLWADGGLHGSMNFPVSEMAWVLARVRKGLRR